MRVDVAIVGAGASGLQCATSLLCNNKYLSILILEARDRFGGRIYTGQEQVKVPTTTNGCTSVVKNEFVRDHGASWVHGIGDKDEGRNPMVELLLQQASSKDITDHLLIPIFAGNAWTRPNTVLHQKNGIAIYVNGNMLPKESPSIPKAIRRHYQLEGQISDRASHLFKIGEGMKTVHMSIGQVRNEFLQSESDDKAVPQENKMEDDDDDDLCVQQLFPFYNFLMENWHGISSSQMQLGFAVLEDEDASSKSNNSNKNTVYDEAYIPDGDFSGAHCKISTGMTTVLQPLVSKVQKHIRFNEQVMKIQNTEVNPGVRIETASGLVVEAKCAVSTIPLGCLKETVDTLFDSEATLSEAKLEAIHSLSSGAYKKVFLTFDRIFWPVEEPLIGLIRENNDVGSSSHPLGKHLLVNNLWANKGLPCLEVILCGDLGKWAIHKSDKTIEEAVLEFLEDSMGLSSSHQLSQWCTDCHITRWEEDPFTLGSYSSFQLGTLERHVDALRDPEWDGRLVFAGECTESEHMGSVHAALMSGERAATDVQEYLLRQATGGTSF
jgi:monoamine oxidase